VGDIITDPASDPTQQSEAVYELHRSNLAQALA